MDGFLGSIYLQYIGASIVWLYMKLLEKFFNKDEITFDEILGRKEKDNYRKLDYSGINLIIGLIFIFSILMVIKFYPRVLYLLRS